MSIHVALTHRTTYRYDRPHPRAADRPPPACAACRTPILSYSLTIAPETHFLNWQQDPHGNYLARLVFPEETRSRGHGGPGRRHDGLNPFDFFLEPDAERTRSPTTRCGATTSRLHRRGRARSRG